MHQPAVPANPGHHPPPAERGSTAAATPTRRPARRRQIPAQLQVEYMSSFAVRVFLYSWYVVLLVGLIAQARNVDLQWEARELCGAEPVSLDALTSWNSSACVELQKYWVPADGAPLCAHPLGQAPLGTARRRIPEPSSHSHHHKRFLWVEAPALTDLFPATTTRMNRETPMRLDAMRQDNTTTTTTSIAPRPTMQPLVKRFAIRWTSAKTLSNLLDRRMNRFTHLLLSLASPMDNMTGDGGDDSTSSIDRGAPRGYRHYHLRVALEEEPFDPSSSAGRDSAASHTDSDASEDSSQTSSSSWSPSLSVWSRLSSATLDASSSEMPGSDSQGPERFHYVYNATITCFVDRPRCTTLVLPRSVVVMTTRNESRFSLTLLDVEPELALAARNPTAIGVWYQRAWYTLGTLVWRCTFLIYSTLSCLRFLYRSRHSELEDRSRPSSTARPAEQRRPPRRLSWSYEQCCLFVLLLCFLCYLDPLFVPGVYEWPGIPASVYHFLEFHFPNYFLAVLLCFCVVTSVACGQRPVLTEAMSRGRVGAPGGRPVPPPWLHLLAGIYLSAVFVLDVAQGFFEDWEWGTEAVCDDQFCRGLRVGLNVVLLAGFAAVLVVLWWLRGRLAELPYLETRPQQLIGRMLMFVLSGSFFYLIAMTVMLSVLHARILALVYFQPLTQAGHMVVVTTLVNHITYLFTPVAVSSRVPIRPEDARWKQVRWPSRWFRWLDMHGGSLYVFSTEAEERYFRDVQRGAVPSRHRHGHRGDPLPGSRDGPDDAAEAREDHEGCDPHDDDDVERKRPPPNTTPHDVSETAITAHEEAGQNGDASLPSSAVFTSFASTTATTTPPSEGGSIAPPLPSPALALDFGLLRPPARAGVASDTHSVLHAHSAEDDAGVVTSRAAQRPSSAPDTCTAERTRAGVVVERTGSRPGSARPAGRPSEGTSAGAVLSLVHGAEATLLDGTGVLIDRLEEALLERPLYTVLYGDQGGEGGRGRNGASSLVEARRHYFFNVETAMDCFNMAWQAYAVPTSGGDALIETGLYVDPLAGPDAVVSRVERFFRWFFTWLFAFKRRFEDASGTAEDEAATVTTVAVAGDAERLDLTCSATTPIDERVRMTGPSSLPSPSSAAAAAAAPADTPMRQNTRPTPTAASLAPSPSFASRDLNPGLYGHKQLALLNVAGVQVVITALDLHAAVHAGKTPRLVIAFRGTDNVANALQGIRFHQRAWREMPGRLLSARPTVHSGFLTIWTQLKESVLNVVLNALRQAYVFEPFSHTQPSRDNGARRTPARMHTDLPTWRLHGAATHGQQDNTTNHDAPARRTESEDAPPEDPDAFADIFVTGHSLGGALACLCAYSLHRALSLVHYPRSDVCVYTFGQPRLGNASFRDAYNKAVPHTFRVVNESDAVSGWRIWAGHHVGVQVNMDRHGNYICKPMAIERLLRPTGGQGLAVVNHTMLAYAESLNAVADRLQTHTAQQQEPTATRLFGSTARDTTSTEGKACADELAHRSSASDEDCPPRCDPLRCLVPCAEETSVPSSPPCREGDGQ